jgi:hypothetical protein
VLRVANDTATPTPAAAAAAASAAVPAPATAAAAPSQWKLEVVKAIRGRRDTARLFRLQLREFGPEQAALCGRPCRCKKHANLGASHAMNKPCPKMPTAVQQTLQAAGAAGAVPEWTVGALCLAKYAADGKFCPAQVAEVSAKGVEVAFTEYENEFQVCAAKDLKPASPRSSPKFSPVDTFKQEALALIQSALLKDSAPLKFSQFVSDRGAKCLIDLGLMTIIQDAANKLTVQREGAMDVLVSLCSVVGRNGKSHMCSNASYHYPNHAMSFDAVP